MTKSRRQTALLLVGLLAACDLGPAYSTDVSGDKREKTIRVVPADQTYWVEQLASGLRYPFSLTWLPDGDVLITERKGGLRLFRNGELDPNAVSGVPVVTQQAESGLRDVLPDPDYQSNHLIYLLLSEGTYEHHHAAVYRGRYQRGAITEVEPIFRAKNEIGGSAHSSARMIFLPDKTLLIGVPEGHFYKHLAQRLDSHIGKILRLNRDGSVPRDNPFLTTSNALPEIWSYGHRVPTGLYYDADNGSVWEIEPGPKGGDELNLLKPGGNFGWAKATWGFEYSGSPIASMQAGPGMISPRLVWTPSVTPSGLARYHGAVYPAWDGDFFVGQLTGRALERLRIVDGKVVLRETMLAELDERIRDVAVGPDDHLYLLTDNSNGRLLRLQPNRPSTSQYSRVARRLAPGAIAAASSNQRAVDRKLTPVEYENGKQSFIDRCSNCHSVGDIVRGGNVGPDLAGVYGRRAGSRANYNYSEAMASASQVWEFTWLDLFLTDPASYIKGTTMSIPSMMQEPELRAQIIMFLKEESK